VDVTLETTGKHTHTPNLPGSVWFNTCYFLGGK